MKVTVLGKRIKSGVKEAVETAAHFYAAELMSTRLHNTIKLRVEIRKTTLVRKTVLGSAHSKAYGSYTNRNYTVKLRSTLTMAEMLEVLAHEMVHVKQYATKQLQHRKWVSDGKWHTRWCGEEVDFDMPYMSQPWEIEAFAMERKLYLKYKKFIKNENPKIKYKLAA